jgi:N-acetylglutamate synthase-like GNAT family acetyltransferase
MAGPAGDVVIADASPDTIPLRLLLEADPEEAHVRTYLSRSRCLVALAAGAVVGAAVVLPRSAGVHELMNIAVVPSHRDRGIGTTLLLRVIEAARAAGAQRLEVGTGTFGPQLAWYQRAGFRPFAVDRDHFVREYAGPIFEEGLQHKDMLRLAIDFA